MEEQENEFNGKDAKITEWVLSRCLMWRNHRDENYLESWKEYERLWRGLWSGEDSTRDSERSQIVTPALQQAIESHTAEIEEAIFGRGEKFFDIIDDRNDQEKIDVEQIKNQMYEDFKRTKVRKQVSDVVLMGAIYGTGIGEITIAEKTELRPAMRPIVEMGVSAIGVEEVARFIVGLKPINPKNFLIDPTASSIEEALGCAVEEYVSLHSVVAGMESGVYTKIENLGQTAVDTDLEPVQEDIEYQQDKVKLLRYYGLVPKYLIEAKDGEEVVELFAKKQEEFGTEAASYTELVEGIVVIANDQHLLKAELTPYMMEDRPIVAFQNDSMPNRFWGRGIAEKGYNMQKAIDAQIRAHLDSLALTTVPMMGIDATRLPRGAKFEVRPGKTILTNGNPAEVLQPFKFGNTDPGNLQTAGEFMRMMLMATGTVDSASIPAATTTDGAGISAGLSAIIKKNKRTLVNFQEQFLIPFVTKAAYRFMQFDPENYPAQDFKFVPSSNLGIIAREYEQMQFMNLLKTLGPDSPIVPMVMMSIIENSGLNNREQLIAQMQQMMQPNPEQQQLQQASQQIQLQGAQAIVAKTTAEAQREAAEAQKVLVETQLLPEEMRAKVIASVSRNLPDEDNAANREFDRRIKVAELMLKEKEMENDLKVVELQTGVKMGKVQDIMKKQDDQLKQAAMGVE
jgi:hypothetical protein